MGPTKRLIVTKEQFENGYVEYRSGGIPNMISHPYKNPILRPDGSYEVDSPMLESAGQQPKGESQ